MLGGLRFRTLEKLTFLWKTRSVIGRWSRLRRGQDVKTNLVVKEVAALVSFVSWELYESALMLVEYDSGAQRLFFRTSEFDGCGSKQFGPPLKESDWFDMVSRFIEISVADEIRGLGEILRKADSGVGRHGMMATVGCRYPQGRVNRYHERHVSWHIHQQFGSLERTARVPQFRSRRRKPAGDTDGSSTAPLRNAQEVVEEGPPPREGQCMQNTVEANPPGSLCFVKSSCDLLCSHLQCSSFHEFFRSPVVFIGHR